MSNKPIEYYGLDFEASGTNPWGLHAPIEIGIVLEDYQIESRIGAWSWSEWEWQEEAEAVHGIPKEALQGAPNVWKVDVETTAWGLRNTRTDRMNRVIVGWNVAGYDRQFITRHMPNLNRFFSYRAVDLNSLLYAKTNTSKEYGKLKHEAKAYAEAVIGEKAWHSARFDAAAALASFEYLRNV